jgi:molecular chaperone DnaK
VDNKEAIVGIDLGTTYSEIAVFKNNQPCLLGGMLPSCVGLDDSDAIIVGEVPLNQAVVKPLRTIRSIKRKMGGQDIVTLGEQQFTPPEISAEILKELKRIAEQELGHPVNRAVITIPAYFNDAQRRATRDAGELAGFVVERIFHEPTAAALCYHCEDKKPLTMLVYDLGGGTFDVSIVRSQEGVMEVLASHGNTHLGGDDFDRLLADELRANFKDANGFKLPDDPLINARLLRAAEKAKKDLSSSPFAKVLEEHLIQQNGVSFHLNCEVSRNSFEESIGVLIDETLQSIQAALKDAGLLVKDIDEVILAGGSTRIPLIFNTLERIFNKAPRKGVDPDLCVALGASIQAGIIAGADVQKVLLEITPHSIGVECARTGEFGPVFGWFSKIINRGSKLPVASGEVYYTMADNQKSAHVKVFQGEKEWAKQNVPIGDFMVDGLAQVEAGNEILFNMSLNLDGILVVTAVEKSSGLSKQVQFADVVSPRKKASKAKSPSAGTRKKRGILENADEKPDRDIQIDAARVKIEIEKAEKLMQNLEGTDCEDVARILTELKDIIARLPDADDAETHKLDRRAVQLLEEMDKISYYLE